MCPMPTAAGSAAEKPIGNINIRTVKETDWKNILPTGRQTFRPIARPRRGIN
jgi:hypothetical protein